MTIDLERVAQAAATAALEDSDSARPASDKRPRRRQQRGLSAPKGFLIGAGLVTAGRLVVGSGRRTLLENVQQRLAEYESRRFGALDDER